MTQKNIDQHIKLEPIDNDRLIRLCGLLDKNIRQIENFFEVEISNRGNAFKISGRDTNVENTSNFIEKIYHLSESEEITPKQLHLYLNNSSEFLSDDTDDIDSSIKLKKLIIKPKSNNQKSFIDTINTNTVTFGIGAAGTGKTFLAVACAVNALEKRLVKKIILVRPAIEAGEKLGFLPGDLAEKIDPYLQPLYDSLYECLGFETVNKLLEKKVIEIAPLAFMRGRTLKNSFAILDEAQNATDTQIKMFLTRIGENSKIVVNGDPTQIDLPNKNMSGLVRSKELLGHLKEISIVDFDHSDVVRHPLVSKIVKAYSNNDKS